MIVYHGSTVIVEKPDVDHSYRPLDFGKGFYVTTVEEQAERWARRKADLLGIEHAYINLYEMNEPTTDLHIKQFADNLVEWLDFVCSCRDGGDEYLKYDLIYGKVANDRVFRVVDMYHTGIWDKDRALKEIKAYPSYDQYAFVTKKAIDRMLIFKSDREV